MGKSGVTPTSRPPRWGGLEENARVRREWSPRTELSGLGDWDRVAAAPLAHRARLCGPRRAARVQLSGSRSLVSLAHAVGPWKCALGRTPARGETCPVSAPSKRRMINRGRAEGRGRLAPPPSWVEDGEEPACLAVGGASYPQICQPKDPFFTYLKLSRDAKEKEVIPSPRNLRPGGEAAWLSEQLRGFPGDSELCVLSTA